MHNSMRGLSPSIQGQLPIPGQYWARDAQMAFEGTPANLNRLVWRWIKT